MRLLQSSSIYFFMSLIVSLGYAGTASANINSNTYGKVTPTEVYSLVRNYETVLAYYFQHHKKSQLSKVRAVKLVPVQNKKPENAFVVLNRLSDAVNKLIRGSKLKPVFRVKREKAKAIPAEVYLQAAYNLDTLIHYMNKIEPGKSWGQFYKNNIYKKSKSPNDVYARTDLLVRRMAVITK